MDLSFAAGSRFACVGLVLDLRLADPIDAAIASRDALSALATARRLRARHVVIAGQLHRRKAGAFAAMVLADDAAMLHTAVRAAIHRLTELGESVSTWLVLCDEPTRADVLALLAVESATEGSA